MAHQDFAKIEDWMAFGRGQWDTVVDLAAEYDDWWSPSQIAGLKYWLDATDSGTITTVSGKASGWANKINPAQGFEQGDAAKRPTVGLINGRQALSFTAANSTRLVHSDLSPAITRPFTVLVAAQLRALPATSKASMPFSSALDYMPTKGGTSTLAAADGYSGWVSLDTEEEVGSVDLEPHVFGVHRTWDKYWLTVDDEMTQPLAANGPGITLEYLTAVGCAQLANGTADHFWDGEIGEVLIFDRTLTPIELRIANAYLASKWGATLGSDWVKVSGDDPAKHVRAADAGSMSRGRSTRHGDLESHGSNIKLGNTDGRYTPGNNASPYRPLSDGTPFQRVVTYPLDGDALPLWGGIVSNWTADFEGAASGVARADLQSRVSLLGQKKIEGAAFRGLYSWADAFWPLDDQEGASEAVNTGRVSKVPATVVGTKGAVDFGIVNAPGGYGTQASFTNEGIGSERLIAKGQLLPVVDVVDTWSAGCWVWPLEESTSGTILGIYTLARSAPSGELGIMLNRELDLTVRFVEGTVWFGNGLSVETIEADLDTEIPHHVMVSVTSRHEYKLWIDGEVVAEDTTAEDWSLIDRNEPGGEDRLFERVVIAGADDGTLDGQISQVFLATSIPTPDQIKAIVDLGREEPETADKHWARLCANLGIPAITRGEFTTEILPLPVRDRTVADIAGDIEKFERGRIIVDSQDQLVLMSCSEANKYEPDPLVLLPDEDFNIDNGASTDATGLVNAVSVILPGFGVELNLQDDESIKTRGEHKPGQETVYLTDYVNQWSWASWMINTRSTPKTRIPVVVLHAERLHSNGKLAAVLGLREGDVIQLGDSDHRLPVGMGRWMIKARIDQIIHQFDPNGDWTISLTVVDYVAPFIVEGDTGRAVDTPGSLTLGADCDGDDLQLALVEDPDHPRLTRNPANYPLVLDLDGERVTVTAITEATDSIEYDAPIDYDAPITYDGASPTLLTVERGANGTNPTTHTAGDPFSVVAGILL